jgi:hypothetical protein
MCVLYRKRPARGGAASAGFPFPRRRGRYNRGHGRGAGGRPRLARPEASPGSCETRMVPWARTAVLAASSWFDLLTNGLYIAAALLAAAVVIAVIRRLYRKGAAAPTAGDQLTHYRRLYERGAISQEEFERLRSVLGGQVRREVKGATHPEVTGEPLPGPKAPPEPPPENIFELDE